MLFNAFGVIGLLANVASIAVVLASKDLRKHTFNQLLVALAAFDILFILVSVPVYSFWVFRFGEGQWVRYSLLIHDDESLLIVPFEVMLSLGSLTLA